MTPAMTPYFDPNIMPPWLRGGARFNAGGVLGAPPTPVAGLPQSGAMGQPAMGQPGMAQPGMMPPTMGQPTMQPPVMQPAMQPQGNMFNSSNLLHGTMMLHQPGFSPGGAPAAPASGFSGAPIEGHDFGGSYAPTGAPSSPASSPMSANLNPRIAPHAMAAGGPRRSAF